MIAQCALALEWLGSEQFRAPRPVQTASSCRRTDWRQISAGLYYTKRGISGARP